MNLGVASIRQSRITIFAVLLTVLGGVVSYLSLGRLEDPEFTIKEALIITDYPGASAEQVAREVTNPIELAVQRLGQLDRVESMSMRGRSVVSAIIKARYHTDEIPQVWDELRRKVNDAQRFLPPPVRGTSLVVDDFGDVYGVFLAITGEGYSPAELRRYAEFLRRELLVVENVKSIELFGVEREVVYLEISRQRLAQLGISEESVYALLQSKNVAADGGRVKAGRDHIVVDPEGAFDSAESMLDTPIGSDVSGRQVFLRDVATISRASEEPPRRIMRFDGKPAIGLGVSTVQGGNVVVMGAGLQRRLSELDANRPVGIEIGTVNFQPDAVVEGTAEFMFNLVKAVSIVVVVLLVAMGLRAGLMIGVVLLLTILATLQVMYTQQILIERISLGAFIIALCMLTDNAIVIAESMKVRMEAGEDKIEVVRDVVSQNQWPLFGATGIAVVAFAAIGLSDDSTGEYANSLFWVIAISLMISWVAAITITPLLGYFMFQPRADAGKTDPYASPLFRGYRALLVAALRVRWLVLAACAVLFVASVWGFGFVRQSFFPPATRPQFLVDAFLPAGFHIRESEAFATKVEDFLRGEEGVESVTTFVGGGGLRFLLVYSPEPENRAFVQFLVNVDDPGSVDRVLARVQDYLDTQHPDANAIAKKFLLGPGKGGRVQARFSGPDPAVLRRLAAEARHVIERDAQALCVRDDWRQPEKVIRPVLNDIAARAAGLTRVEVARTLETSLEGRTVGLFREPGGSGGGLFPQEARLLPIVARPPEAERSELAAIGDLQIWSPVARRMIPMGQVVSGVEVTWEDPVIARRDRLETITVHADPRVGLPSELLASVKPGIEAIELPPGYRLEWGGEFEDSNRARAALAKPLPATIVLMIFIVLCIFNSVRSTLSICLTVPLIIIGITAGMLITNAAFGFMAVLGAIALAGEQIKNAIVLVDEFGTQLELGKSPYNAVIDGAVSRLRPVLLVVVTTVLGMIPLLADPFFSAMAVTIMFGLAFAAVLTMLVVPALYTILFKIDVSGRDGKA
jgi:multidrug efflux pump subunit AcrB